MTERTLMVTPYAPYRDGIAHYAVQEVKARRAAGESIEVLSPLPSAAHHHLRLGGVAGAAKLVNAVRPYDRVIIQFFPEMMFGRTRTGAERLAIWGALATLVKLVPTELRIHEIQYQPMRDHESERRAAHAVLSGADRVTVHTEQERTELAEAAGVGRARIEIFDHGSHFAVRSAMGRARARAALGLSQGEHISLCIGFIQAHKGFDRAVGAFLRLDPPDASLHIVGDVRVYHPELEAHARTLANLADSTPKVHFHRRYVGDAEFDTWLEAADVVVLPYREIWSSGVTERAKLFGTPIIAAAVGGIGEQGGAITLVRNDAELMAAMAAAIGVAGEQRPTAVDLGGADQPALQAEIRRRSFTSDLPMETVASPVQDRLADIDTLPMPHPISLKPWINQVKNLVGRATNWQIHPLVVHANESTTALRDAVTLLERRVAELERDRPAAEDDPRT